MNAGALDEFHKRSVNAAAAIGADLELIFVNDGSPDDGLAKAKQIASRNPNIVVIDLSRNFGQARALWTGISRSTGDLVAILDGDLEEDPAWLVQFHERMTEAGCDVVYGVQTKPKGSFGYRSGRRFFYHALNVLAAVRFPTDVTTARLMSRRYVAELLKFGESEFFLLGLMSVVGFAQMAVKVDKQPRSPTTYNIWKLTRLFVNGVTSFSTLPLMFIFLFGLILSSSAALFIIYLLVTAARSTPGWLSVMAALTFFSGIIVLFLGILAIYIGTIFLEVKRRPVTIIREIIGSSDVR
jgi:putative glycosyltransferase